MRKTLTLSKETLRILDDEDLARVVGGAGDSANSGHAKDKHSSCPGKANGHDKDHGSSTN
jgi:hypothetical protein